MGASPRPAVPEYATDPDPSRMAALGVLVLAARQLPTDERPFFGGYVDLVCVYVREEARKNGVAGGLVETAKMLVRPGRGLYTSRAGCRVGAARKLWLSAGLGSSTEGSTEHV